MKEVAVGIITCNDRVLVCQRLATARYPLKWEFPGGKLETGESPEQALKRELQEELDIEAEIGPEIHRQEWVYSQGAAEKQSGSSYRVFYHMVTAFHGTLLNRAFHQIRWVSPEELSLMDILEGNREAVKLLTRDAEKKSA